MAFILCGTAGPASADSLQFNVTYNIPIGTPYTSWAQGIWLAIYSNAPSPAVSATISNFSAHAPLGSVLNSLHAVGALPGTLTLTPAAVPVASPYFSNSAADFVQAFKGVVTQFSFTVTLNFASGTPFSFLTGAQSTAGDYYSGISTWVEVNQFSSPASPIPQPAPGTWTIHNQFFGLSTAPAPVVATPEPGTLLLLAAGIACAFSCKLRPHRPL